MSGLILIPFYRWGSVNSNNPYSRFQWGYHDFLQTNLLFIFICLWNTYSTHLPDTLSISSNPIQLTDISPPSPSLILSLLHPSLSLTIQYPLRSLLPPSLHWATISYLPYISWRKRYRSSYFLNSETPLKWDLCWISHWWAVWVFWRWVRRRMSFW